VLALRVRLRGAESFGETDEHDADRRRRGREVVVDADPVGRPERRQPAVDVADDVEPLASSENRCTSTIPKITATSDAGIAGANRRRPSTIVSDNTPTTVVRHRASPRCATKWPS
jgi:hypothetical protein